VWGERGAGRKLGLSEKIVFLVDWNGPAGQSTGFGVATNCHANGDKKEEKKKVMSFISTSGRSLLLIYPLPSPSCAVTPLLSAVCSSAQAGPLSSGKVPFR